MKLLDKLNNVADLSYWEYGHKAILLFNDGVCAHVKMSREKFNEIEEKYYEDKLKNIISDAGIKNKHNRKKRVNWQGFEDLYYCGYEYKEIAKIIGCGTATVARKVQESIELGILKQRFKGTFSDVRKVELLKEMKIQNKTVAEISEYFNCHKSTVIKVTKALRDRKEL